MIEKTIQVEGKDMKLRCSALIPRSYRRIFGRDMIADMDSLIAAYRKHQKDKTIPIDSINLEVFENVAWLMLKSAGENVGETPEEWLDELSGIFSIYEVLPDILMLWNASKKTTSTPKKK